jgi:hypothetical protein
MFIVKGQWRCCSLLTNVLTLIPLVLSSILEMLNAVDKYRPMHLKTLNTIHSVPIGSLYTTTSDILIL